MAVKDLVDVAGMPTTAGSKAWSRVAERDAACVAALRAAGWGVAGKAHTNEWAFGIDGRNPWRPDCVNPWDRARLPGGSSSGPAVAVAAGLAELGLGTDTSGSIRVPAALCGVVGLRTTPGRVPLEGVLPLAPTYDVVGFLARDAATLVRALGAEAAGAPAEPRLGLVSSLLAEGDERVLSAVRAAAGSLGRVEAIDVPGLDAALEVHRVVQHYEACRSYAETGCEIDDLAPDVAERIRGGWAISDDGYAVAQRARATIAEAIVAAVEPFDALVAPTVPIVAPLRATEPNAVRGALLSCVVPFSQAPVPSVSVPCGTVDGLPVGLQLIGSPGEDEALLALSGSVRRP